MSRADELRALAKRVTSGSVHRKATDMTPLTERLASARDYACYLLLVYVPFRLMPFRVKLWLAPFAGSYAYAPARDAATNEPCQQSGGR